MSIVTPVPLGGAFNNINQNTESARRDNLAREIIPQPSQADDSGAEKGVGAESDRARQNQLLQNPTYEKPSSNNSQSAEGGQESNGSESDKDNGKDESAGKEQAEERQRDQLSEQEVKEVQDLKERDREVRNHEQAHANVGGQYAGAPEYEYQRGPDGQQYAVGGEVSIDISEESSPQETVQKMERVRSAALAPAEPSPQDYRVANEAQQIATEARSDIAKESLQQAQQSSASESAEDEGAGVSYEAPSPDETADGGISVGRRRLAEADPVAESAGLATDSQPFKQMMANRDMDVSQRALRIASFYTQTSQPFEPGRVQQQI